MLNITEVRVKLMEGRSDRLRAFCSMTIDDDFVVHDLRVIEGEKGNFVAMPSRKLSDSCPQCGGKNHLRASYCNDCGAELDEDRAEGRKLHVDVAHPINTPCREHIQDAVLEAYEEDIGRKQNDEEPKHIFLEDDLAALGAEKEHEAAAEDEEQQPEPAEDTEEAEEEQREAPAATKDEETGEPSFEPEEEAPQEEPVPDESSPWPDDEHWIGPTEEEGEEKKEEKEEEDTQEEPEEEEDEFHKGIF